MSIRLIGIAGPSGSGKSTLAAHLARMLGEERTAVVSVDQYYRDLSGLPPADRACRNFDDPAAIEHPLLIEHARQLAAGATVSVPEYDYASHRRIRNSVRVVPHDYVLYEGMFTLYWPEFRDLLHLPIYLHASESACLARRMARDVAERGRTAVSVLQQYHDTVRPMRKKFIEPTKRFADLLLDGCGSVSDSVHEALDFINGGVTAA